MTIAITIKGSIRLTGSARTTNDKGIPDSKVIVTTFVHFSLYLQTKNEIKAQSTDMYKNPKAQLNFLIEAVIELIDNANASESAM